MFSFIPTPYNWIAAAVLALALTAAGAWGGAYAAHTIDKVAYQALQLKDSQAQTKSVTDSLDQLQGFITTMHGADVDYSSSLTIIAQDFANLKKELANATVHPLPADCKPDAGRLRVLTDAVAAANKGAGAVK